MSPGTLDLRMEKILTLDSSWALMSTSKPCSGGVEVKKKFKKAKS